MEPILEYLERRLTGTLIHSAPVHLPHLHHQLPQVHQPQYLYFKTFHHLLLLLPSSLKSPLMDPTSTGDQVYAVCAL